MEADEPVARNSPAQAERKWSWGSKLFFATLLVILIFFWWLLIFSGGVTGKHG